MDSVSAMAPKQHAAMLHVLAQDRARDFRASKIRPRPRRAAVAPDVDLGPIAAARAGVRWLRRRTRERTVGVGDIGLAVAAARAGVRGLVG
jgi:hypothetical protein